MVKFPGSARGRRLKKLINVLDHMLRVGDEAVSESIIKAYRERGLTPPEHLEAPPTIKPGHYVYWEAYQDLQTERVHPRGTIPINAIVKYAQAYQLDFDVLKRIIWRVDKTLLAHWKGLDEIEKNKASAPTKPALNTGA